MDPGFKSTFEVPKIKELEIVLQNDFNVKLHYAFPLCIILQDKKYIPWFYEHYIDICVETYKDGINLWYPDAVSYVDTQHYNNQAIYMNFIDYKLLENDFNIINFIIDKINLDLYSVVFVDEYYISESQHYSKQHFVHEFLIYGYDDIKEQLMAVGFDKRRNFTKLLFSYSEFRKAFEKGKDYCIDPGLQDRAIVLLGLYTHKNEYPFDISRFLLCLQNYTLSKIDSDQMFFWRFDEKKADCISFGISAYDAFIDYLEKILKCDCKGNYINFHFLYENKKAIHKRLEYIVNRYNIRNNLLDMTNEYGNIVKNVDVLRKLFMKVSIASGGDGIYLSDISKVSTCKDTIIRMIDIINLIKKYEKNLMNNICEQIETEFL